MTDRTAYPPLNLFVAGEWIAVAERETQTVINPATDEPLGELPMATAGDLDRAIAAAANSFQAWRATPVLERGRTLVVIDHDMDALFELAERITVLQEGRVLVEGTPDEIKGNAKVQEAYLGGVHGVIDEQEAMAS